jgi:hypothetical protein
MRVLGAVILLTLVALGGGAGRPQSASGCSGSALTFAEAIGLSDGAIYAGRVTRVETAGEAWLDLTIDVDLVVRGPASRNVPRAQAGVACEGISEGEWGYIVRGIHDERDQRATNMFFRMSSTAARDALQSAGLPDTSAATWHGNGRPGSWHQALLLIAAVAGFGLTAGWPGIRRRGIPPAMSSDISER